MLERIHIPLVIILALVGCSEGHDEIGHKDDYSFLQATSTAWQSSPLEDGNLFVLDEESGRCAVGVVREEGGRVWILLNHPTDVLRLPDADVRVDAAELADVSALCEPSRVVRDYLDQAGGAE